MKKSIFPYLLLVSLSLFISSCEVDEWTNYKVDSLNIHAGLWSVDGVFQNHVKSLELKSDELIKCANGDSDSLSENSVVSLFSKALCQKLLAARAFTVMATIICGLSLIGSVMHIASIVKSWERLAFISKLGCLLSCVFGVIGFAIALDALKLEDSNSSLGLSGILSIIAWSMALFSGMIAIIVGNTRKSYPTPPIKAET
jgi:hypothetical protein